MNKIFLSLSLKISSTLSKYICSPILSTHSALIIPVSKFHFLKMILGSYLTSLIKTSNISNLNFVVHFFLDTIKSWKYKAQSCFLTNYKSLKQKARIRLIFWFNSYFIWYHLTIRPLQITFTSFQWNIENVDEIRN